MARRPFDIAAHGWEKVEYRRGDVLDRDSVDSLVEEADVVVHLAFVIVAGGDEPRDQPGGVPQRLRGDRRRRRQAARLHLLRRRLRLRPRPAGAARGGRAAARQLPPSLLRPQGRGRGAAERGPPRLRHRRLRLPPLHRRRPRRDDAARPDPAGRGRPGAARARFAGRSAGCRRCGRSCPTPGCRSSSSTRTTSPRRSRPP